VNFLLFIVAMGHQKESGFTGQNMYPITSFQFVQCQKQFLEMIFLTRSKLPKRQLKSMPMCGLTLMVPNSTKLFR